MANEKNNVHIQGFIRSCAITETGDNAVIAQMEICTMAKKKDGQGKTTLANPLYHRAAVVATGDKAERLRDISNRCGDPKNNITASIMGQLTTDKNGTPMIAVNENNLDFPEKKGFRNHMLLEGELMQSSYNDAYASAILRTTDSEDRNILVPIIIYCSDNPTKWSDLSSGKIRKGDILSVSGPLISKCYSDGRKQLFRCSVNVSDYKVVSRQLKKENTISHGV